MVSCGLGDPIGRHSSAIQYWSGFSKELLLHILELFAFRAIDRPPRNLNTQCKLASRNKVLITNLPGTRTIVERGHGEINDFKWSRRLADKIPRLKVQMHDPSFVERG